MLSVYVVMAEPTARSQVKVSSRRIKWTDNMVGGDDGVSLPSFEVKESKLM